MTLRQEQIFERHQAAGMRLYKRGADAEAEQELLAATHVARHCGIDDERLGATLYQLGELAQAHGHFPAAEQRFVDALSIEEHALGADHPYVAMVLRAYAELLRRDGRLDQAACLMARAEVIWGGAVSAHPGERVPIF